MSFMQLRFPTPRIPISAKPSGGGAAAAARRIADAGATEHEIAAITGHESLREVERYEDEE